MSISVGKVVGFALFAGATAAVVLWPNPEFHAQPDNLVRPIRSEVVAAGARMPDIYLTGRVRASEDRTLAFKQYGRIQRIPVVAGQKVKKGDKLAWLDPIDFEKDLAKAESVERRDRLTYQRKAEALKKNAISQEEVSQAEAQLRQSEAQLALSKRALEDTVLYAPFDGTVAEVPATELDMVTPQTRVVLVHDLSKVKIDAVCPETMVITAKKFSPVRGESNVCEVVTASFDSVPGRKFPVKFVEYVSNADSRTQTYVATYEMDAPNDLMLFPGMSATLFISGEAYRHVGDEQSKLVSIPESALGVSDDGSFFVWVLEATAEPDVHAVRLRRIEVSDRANGRVSVKGGLSVGERIATAGVSVLTEGRKVRLQSK